MKVTWIFERKRYTISGHRGGKLYLNKIPCDECKDILRDLESGNVNIQANAKFRAKALYIKLRERYNHPSIALNEEINRHLEYERKQSDKEWKRECMKQDWPFYVVGVVFVGFFLYLVFKVWWFFIGDSAFEGPFADDISAGDVTFRTIVFFIAFIVIIEEVIRRIRNGHF